MREEGEKTLKLGLCIAGLGVGEWVGRWSCPKGLTEFWPCLDMNPRQEWVGSSPVVHTLMSFDFTLILRVTKGIPLEDEWRTGHLLQGIIHGCLFCALGR